MNQSKELEIIVIALKKIYKIAMKKTHLNMALQAQKAIANVITKVNNKEEKLSLSKLSKQQIEELIKESEENETKI